MLVLPIKKKWYDLILRGVKTEEYREIKPYWATRFVNAGLLEYTFRKDPACTMLTFNRVEVMFRNGYSDKSPSFIATVGLTRDFGKPEWGAKKGVKYYVLHIYDIRRETKG